ncbi:MAG: right-handed parallel beta-helix repeat-containing protein [Candidatus Desantisbacteria bacterium]
MRTAANSPYLVTGNVFVKGTATVTLTIESGVEVRFATNTSLIIGGTGGTEKGKLMADGSEGTITFTADGTTTAGYWGGIIFNDYSDDGSLLMNVVVEYGNANIYCINASPSIQKSIIKNSSGYGIRCENSSPWITNDTIKDNSSHGIFLEGSSKPTIAISTITGNNYGIYCKDTVPQPTMDNNTIAANTFAMRISPNTDFSTNTIYGNTNERIEILGGNITSNKLWKNFNHAYVILGTVSVKGAATATLTIEPSVHVRFATNTSLIIGGEGVGKLIG